MKLLSKIAKIAGQVLVTFTGLEPVIRGFLPDEKTGVLTEIKDTMLEVRDAVISAETMAAAMTGTISGDEKLRMAGSLASDIILKSALVADRKVKDEALFKKGANSITSGMADILNSLDDDLDEDNHG